MGCVHMDTLGIGVCKITTNSKYIELAFILHSQGILVTKEELPKQLYYLYNKITYYLAK